MSKLRQDPDRKRQVKWGIAWNQASTKRGAVWLITAAIGLVFLFQDKPVDQLLLLAAAVAGGLGLMERD